MTSLIEDHPEESTRLKHQQKQLILVIHEQFSDHWENTVIAVLFLTLY